jgi:hypothetical protein
MRQRRSALLVVSFAVATTLMGFATGGATSAATPNHTIVVTRSDSGRSYTLRTGDHLDVYLSGPDYAIWAEPISSNEAVLTRTGGSSGATARAHFFAVRKGEAKVSATPSLVCSSVCAGPSLPVFEVSVTVVGAGSESAPSRTILVTYADNGRHYRVQSGDYLDVQLSGPSSNVSWTEPATSERTVVRRISGSSGMTAIGIFVARAEGKAQVTAFGTINCSPPCPPPILLFRINVSVVT